MSHPGVGFDKLDRPQQGDGDRQQGRADLLLCLVARRLRLQGRERQALQLQFRDFHRRQELDPGGLRDLGAVRSGKAGRLQAERVPARRLRLFQLRHDDRHAARNRRKESRSRAALRRCLRDRLVPLPLRRQRQSERRDQARQSGNDGRADRLHHRQAQGIWHRRFRRHADQGHRRDDRRAGEGLLRQDGAGRRWSNPTTDYKKAYTLQFVNKGVGLDLRPK